MAKADQSLAGEFDAFTPTDNEYEDVEKLEDLMKRWKRQPNTERLALLPHIFGIFERNPDCAELGTPGPAVHTLESVGGYEEELAASMGRMPSFYAMWMVNRILNDLTKPAQRAPWLALMQKAAKSKKASDFIKEEAQAFLEQQESEE